MTATLTSTSPETDRCPACGKRLMAIQEADGSARLSSVSTDFSEMAKGLPALLDVLDKMSAAASEDGKLPNAIVAAHLKAVRAAIAAIPGMLAEIERDRLWHGNDQKLIREMIADNDRLRSLIAEMREAVTNVKMMDLGDRAFIGVKADEFSFASAHIHAEDREIFLKWKAKHDAILSKTEKDQSP